MADEESQNPNEDPSVEGSPERAESPGEPETEPETPDEPTESSAEPSEGEAGVTDGAEQDAAAEPDAAEPESVESSSDGVYSSDAETDAERSALEMAQAAMASLNDEESSGGDMNNQEYDALAAAEAAIGSLNDEVDATTSAEQAADADAEAEAAMAQMMGGGEQGAGAATTGATPFDWQDFGLNGDAGDPEKIDLLGDVKLNVKIELGRTRMLVEDVLRLDSGSVVELDKLAGDPVDVYVNGQPVARGEVLVLNDNFCVRINEILSTAQAEAIKAKM